MFKPDQTVTYEGMRDPATVISGPHASQAGERWLVRLADGNVALVRGARLKPLDDRRERVARIIRTGIVGRDRWDTASATGKDQYRAVADAVLAELDAKPKPSPLAVGEQIRILKHNHNGAQVLTGDILTVKSLRDSSFYTDAPRSLRPHWIFSLCSEGSGWERA
jgi:hypothetical protein